MICSAINEETLFSRK